MKNLNLFCPINGTGYGISSTNIAISLAKQGIDVALHAIGSSSVETEDQQNSLMPMINRSKTYDPKATSLKIWHQHDLASRIGVGKYYAFPFFELDTFMDFEVHGMNQTDGLFTTSQWGKNVLESNGVNVPIHIAHLGVDFSSFFVDEDKIRVENENYVFMHVGKWEKRKGHDFLIEAFNNAFTKNDNVELWLFPFNPFLSKQESDTWNGLVSSSELSDKIKVYGRLPTQRHMAEAMKMADCGIFPSRAEGWNMGLVEMMSLKKPIIATNYSAHTEYLNSENSFLIDITEKELAVDGKWFNGQGNWAKLSEKQMEQTVEHMRFVYNNKVRSNVVGFDAVKRYSWDGTASAIRSVIFN